MGYPLPLSRIRKDLEAWDEGRPANKGVSAIVPHNKRVTGRPEADSCQLLVVSC